MKKFRPTSRAFTKFLKLTLGTFLVVRYGLRAENRRILTDTNPSYLLLPNHVSFWDPFFVAYFTPKPIYWVTSDRQFRNPILRYLLSLVGAIPKSKAVADFETVRAIFQVKKNNGIVGIFAEGRRNWDGHSLPLIYPTAKLVKALGIPVIVPIIKGAFLTLPRWSSVRRKGRVIVEFRYGPTPEELKRMSVDEVYRTLSEHLRHDEWEYQRERMIRYRSRHRADGLELSIFLCQSCGRIGSLESAGNEIRCAACGFTAHITEYGFFDGESRFKTIRDWNLWQLGELRSRLSQCGTTNETCCFSDGPVVVMTGFRSQGMKPALQGECLLLSDRVRVRTRDGEEVDFEIDRIVGVNVQLHEQMEFYYGDRLYSFVFERPVSGYKWMIAIQMLQGKEPESVEMASV